MPGLSDRVRGIHTSIGQGCPVKVHFWMVDGELNVEPIQRRAVMRRRREHTHGKVGWEGLGWNFGEGGSGGRCPWVRGGGGAVAERWNRQSRRWGSRKGGVGGSREVQIGHVASKYLLLYHLITWNYPSCWSPLIFCFAFLRRLCTLSGSSFSRRLIYSFYLDNGVIMPLEGISIFCLRPMSNFLLLEIGPWKKWRRTNQM